MNVFSFWIQWYQITSITIVYSTVYAGTDQIKDQSSASLAFVRGIHRWPVNSQHKGPVTRKMLPCDDFIMMRRWMRLSLVQVMACRLSTWTETDLLAVGPVTTRNISLVKYHLNLKHLFRRIHLKLSAMFSCLCLKFQQNGFGCLVGVRNYGIIAFLGVIHT